MVSKKISDLEGSWFAVPLMNTGYGLGLAARVGTRGGIVLGYFFGPRHVVLPSLKDTSFLKPSDAILIRQFCDTGLKNGTWPIVQYPEKWQREDWPQPAFSHIDVVDSSKAFRREYPPDNPSDLFLREIPISLEEARLLPEDGLSGHVALQIKLTMLLST